jgi:hypothetical protein
MPNKYINIIGLVVLTCVALNAKAFEDVRHFYSADASVGSDSNLSNAEQDQNIIADRFINMDVHAVVKAEISFNKAIILDLAMGYKAFEFTPSLNQSELSLSAIYRWQNTFKYRSPWFQVMLSNQVLEFDGSQRDSNVYQVQAMSSARLTTQINWVLGLEYKKRDSNGSVFDTNQSRIFGNLDYKLLNKGTLYGGMSYIDGDIVSSVQSQYCNGLIATSIYDLLIASEQVEWDSAFSNDYCGNWISYRLPAKMVTVTAGYNFPIDHRNSFDISWMLASIEAKGDNQYQRHILQANYLKTF